MVIEISGRNYEVSDRIRKVIDTKMKKVLKYFEDTMEVRCVLHRSKFRFICDMSIIGKNYDVKASQQADSMEDAINATVDHLKRQASENRKKIRDHKRNRSTPNGKWMHHVIEPGVAEPERTRVVRPTSVPVRPMSVEQAALALDDSKREFIVFRDLDTDKVTVMYKRRDENFGVIAPEY